MCFLFGSTLSEQSIWESKGYVVDCQSLPKPQRAYDANVRPNTKANKREKHTQSITNDPFTL